MIANMAAPQVLDENILVRLIQLYFIFHLFPYIKCKRWDSYAKHTFFGLIRNSTV